MSKIGKQPIQIPPGVEVKINGNLIVIRGPKGELQREVAGEIKVELKDNQLFLSVAKETKKSPALWGLFRMLLYNMVQGVKNGFEKKLEIEGIGYKAILQGKDLILNLGYSHPVEFKAASGIEFKVEKNVITVSGVDKELVGQTAAEIRALAKPEPYKGKGIRYQEEIVKLKEGKKAVKGAF